MAIFITLERFTSFFLSFVGGETPTWSLDYVGGEDSIDRVRHKRLCQTVADFVYGLSALD